MRIEGLTGPRASDAWEEEYERNWGPKPEKKTQNQAQAIEMTKQELLAERDRLAKGK